MATGAGSGITATPLLKRKLVPSKTRLYWAEL